MFHGHFWANVQGHAVKLPRAALCFILQRSCPGQLPAVPHFHIRWGRESRRRKQNLWVEIRQFTNIEKRERIIIKTNAYVYTYV